MPAALVIGMVGGLSTFGAGLPAGPASAAQSNAAEHGGEFHPVQANEAFARPRGQSYEKTLATAQSHAAALPLASLSGNAPSATWTAIGPQPESGGDGGANSGRITGLALGTSSIFAASAGGGVWSSANNGTSWATHTDSQPDIAMGSVAVDPSNSSYVFGGTGEDNECLDCFYGAGILESSDGGGSWTTSNPGGVFTGVDIASIVVEPGASSIATTKVLAGTSHGLYVSADGGSTWSLERGTGWANGNVTSIVLNLLTGSIAIYAAVAGVGVEESTDNGSTWSKVDSFSGFGALAISPNAVGSKSVLYLSVGSYTGYLGMFKSTNGGSTWSRLTSTPLFTSPEYAYDGTSGDGGDQSWYDNVVTVDPKNPQIVVAAGIAAVESTDGGSTWTNLNGGGYFTTSSLFHPDFHTLVFDAAGDLYMGNDGGAWELPATDVSGPTLSFINLNTNLDITQFYAGMEQSGNAAEVLGGSQDNGTNLYSSSASPSTTWKEVVGGDGGFAAIDPASASTQYAEADISSGGGCSGCGLLKTTNGWGGFSNVTPPFSSTNWAAPLTIVPGTSGPTVLFGGDYVYESTNGGTTWSALGFASSHHGAGSTSDVSAIAVAPSNSSVLYAGFDDGTLQMSSNGGSTWTALSPPAGGLGVTHIAVSATDPYTVYATFATLSYGFPYKPSGPGVLRGSSLNGTASWTNVAGNLPAGVPANSVVPDGSGGLLVADDTGVYWAKTLSGASTTWSRLGTGLPNVQVMDLALSPGGTLVADTHGRGAWTIPFSSGSNAADGSGALSVQPASVTAGSKSHTLTLTYSAATGGLAGGEIDALVPAGWSVPSTTGTAAGFTTSTCGTVSVAGSTIKVSPVTLMSGTKCTITYGSKAGAGPGVTVPTLIGIDPFTTTEKSTPTGTLKPLAVLPSIKVVNAADGSGALSVQPASVTAGSKSHTLTLTYSAATGGLAGGEIRRVGAGGLVSALDDGHRGGLHHLDLWDGQRRWLHDQGEPGHPHEWDQMHHHLRIQGRRGAGRHGAHADRD